ncbi:MAG: histone-like nucleoid-structuring protein [Reyranella sp.]|nr:histone-like nucleoid-structuring protein [Reyranella sp.]
MKRLDSMDFDELLALRVKVEAAITARVERERKRLTASLERLNTIRPGDAPPAKRGVRGAAKGKKLTAKYRNPENVSEVWAGRGNRPRWLVAALKGGRKKLVDFAVAPAK